jgi:hypothetical protein
MQTTTGPSPASFPAPLRAQVRRAARLSGWLAGIIGRVDPEDESFVWLIGRHDEVRAFVGVVMREWSEGMLDTLRASERIGTYARGLEESARAFFHPSRPTLPAFRVRPRNDTLVDA